MGQCSAPPQEAGVLTNIAEQGAITKQAVAVDYLLFRGKAPHQRRRGLTAEGDRTTSLTQAARGPITATPSSQATTDVSEYISSSPHLFVFNNTPKLYSRKTKLFFHNWKKITSDTNILSWIGGVSIDLQRR